MFRPIQTLYSYLQLPTIFYSAIMLWSLSVSPHIWWRYVWTACLTLVYLQPLTHKRYFDLQRWWWWGASRYPKMARKVTSGGIEPSVAWVPPGRDRCKSWKLTNYVSGLLGGSKKKHTLVLQYTAGKSLVEHLCKHKTSSSALGGLQRNVSSEQALNQLCLAPQGSPVLIPWRPVSHCSWWRWHIHISFIEFGTWIFHQEANCKKIFF